MTITTTTKGPIFDGSASDAIAAFQDEAERAVGDHIVAEIKQELGRVLRHPTGRYQGKIQTTRARDNNLVTDGNVTYGPWLEGVSSRNRATRFKGYATFRRVAQRLQDEAGPIAEKVLPEYLERMR